MIKIDAETREWLGQVVAREAAATPGPWREGVTPRACPSRWPSMAQAAIFSGSTCVCHFGEASEEPDGQSCGLEPPEEDLAFIVHARADISRLLDLLRRCGVLPRVLVTVTFPPDMPEKALAVVRVAGDPHAYYAWDDETICDAVGVPLPDQYEGDARRELREWAGV